MRSLRPPPACVGYANTTGRITAGCPLLAAPGRAPEQRVSLLSHAADKSTRSGSPRIHGARPEAQDRKLVRLLKILRRLMLAHEIIWFPGVATSTHKKSALNRGRLGTNLRGLNQRGSDVVRTILLLPSTSESDRKSSTAGAFVGQPSIVSRPSSSLLAAWTTLPFSAK